MPQIAIVVVFNDVITFEWAVEEAAAAAAAVAEQLHREVFVDEKYDRDGWA